MKWYRLAADQGVRQAMNRMAWLLATCPVDRFCDGPSAIELAQDSLGKNPSDGYLDTLAAAHARSGQFDEAIAVVEKVEQEPPDGGPRELARVSEHIAEERAPPERRVAAVLLQA